MNGIVNAETQHKGRHGGLEGREPSTGDVENAVRPDEGACQADERERHAGEGTEGHGQHHDNHGEGQQHEQEQVVEGAFVDVVGQQVVGDDLVGQR